MSTIISSIAEKLRFKRQTTESSYKELVQATAAGESVKPDAAVKVVEQAGVSVERFEEDVKALQRKTKLQGVASDYEAASVALKEAGREYEQLSRDYWQAREGVDKDFTPRLAAAQARQGEAQDRLARARQARTALASDDANLPAIRDADANARAVRNERDRVLSQLRRDESAVQALGDGRQLRRHQEAELASARKGVESGRLALQAAEKELKAAEDAAKAAREKLWTEA